MPLVPIVADLLLFLGLILGLGLPWVLAARWDAAEKLTLGVAAGVFQIYVVAWLVYWTGLPGRAFFILPALALVATAVQWRKISALLADREVQGLLGRQLLFAGWCAGWLALVRSYGGGEWSADWYEHFERALFFLDRQPLETVFLNIYSLPARPPLANLVDGAFMGLVGKDFATYQLFNTLSSTLLFLPAALLGRHFSRGRRGSDAVLLLLLMLNPLVLQNATYSWTKLLTVFFILLAVAFYVRGLAEDDATRRTLAIGAIAAALVTHYSAGPYAFGLAAAQLVLVWTRRRESARWRELFLQGLVAAAVLATWFAWSLLRYGAQTTFFSNTTATGAAGVSAAESVGRLAWNIFVTLVPHPLHAADYIFISQTSALGYARDYLFNIYQTTLPGAVGAGGLVLFAWCLTHRRAPAAVPAERRFWRWFPVAVFLLSIATASWLDRWGVVHICLPALVIVGLAWLAARLREIPAGVRRLWVGALALDVLLGIALHFYLQATLVLAPHAAQDLVQGKILEFSQMATKNMLLKLLTQSVFVSDDAPAPALILLFLVGLLVLAIRQSHAPAQGANS